MDFATVQDWRLALETDLREIAAADLQDDQAGGPYILLRSELPTAKRHSDFGGLFSPTYCSTFRDMIGDRLGEPGPTFIVCDNQFASDSEFAHLTAITAHEFCHAFDEPTLRPPMVRSQYRELMQEIELDEIQQPTPPDFWDWQQFEHGSIPLPAFYRRLFHLAYRLVQRGWRCPVTGLTDWPETQSGRSFGWEYFDALHSELERLQVFSIRQVDAITPPGEFLRAFDQEVIVRNRKQAVA